MTEKAGSILHVMSVPRTVDLSGGGIEIIKEKEVPLLGFDFSFYVIGWSHAVISHGEGFAYSEVLSCKNIFNTDMEEFDIKGENTYAFKNDVGTYRIEGSVWAEALRAFEKESYGLQHTFENGGFTGIYIGENEYETLHTYPEYGRAVYSKTSFRPK